tara:strand:+ start:236 stop:1240 length:1005 start_codon:yes stop_codon:yes gene_type:complete
MRILLSPKSKKLIYYYLKDKHKSNSLKELSLSMDVPIKTLDSWFYKKDRYIPKHIIDLVNLGDLEILDKKEDKWGQIKGGVNSFELTTKKYGIKEIKRMQALGGKRGAKTKNKLEERKFRVDIKDPLFLEFYGALIGDGWINSLNSSNKWLIGICGHLSLDEDYIYYIREIVKKMFSRSGCIVKRPDNNTLEFRFKHRVLVNYLHKDLGFPLGKKKDLRINEKIMKKGFSRLRHVIRGIFDTDGTFYLQKRKFKNSSPCLAIHMNSPFLINQIKETLISNGFKAHCSDNGKMVRLAGYIQLNKWMKEIGSSNPKHLNKIKNFVPVAQLDSATAS